MSSSDDLDLLSAPKRVCKEPISGVSSTDSAMAGTCVPKNPHLSSMDGDFLYHIGYSREDSKDIFKDVKFVVAGGSASRMKSFAELIAKEINHAHDTVEDLKIQKTDRFAFYKIGPVLSISHGMGVPSITIMLHEILKLLHYAEAQDPIIIRIGTSGGINVEAGTVVVTNKAFNAFLKQSHEVVVLGKTVSRYTEIDQDLVQEIVSCQKDHSFKTVASGTMCTDDFYEGQGRLDGAICEFTLEKKMEYLETIKEAGVSNIEMECTAIASLCHQMKVKCAVVCVALLDRLQGDQVVITPEDYAMFSLRPQALVANFIKTRLQKDV